MEEEHIELLRSLGIRGINAKNATDSGYWLDRANKFQAIATQNRAVYNYLAVHLGIQKHLELSQRWP